MYVDVYHGFPTWKTYHKPSKIAVQYTFLLRQKRELKQFVKSFHTQVSSHGFISSCSIFDKNVQSELDAKNINIYFLDKRNKALLLKYFVDKSLAKRNYNNVILFYTNRKTTFELLNSNIYVNTDNAEWEQFYSLFEFLLRFSSKSILEIQFYVAFVCKDMISKELKFWHSLCRSTCIERKKKSNGSTDRCLRNNLQFSNLSEESCFKMKNSVSPINLLSKKCVVQNVVSKLVIKEISTYKLRSNLCLKRKSVDSEKGSKAKFLKNGHGVNNEILCKCSENKWKMLGITIKHNELNYTDILESRDAVYSQPTHIHTCFDKSLSNESMLEYQTNMQASLNKIHCAKTNLCKIPLTVGLKNVGKANINGNLLGDDSGSQQKTDISVKEGDKETRPLDCEFVKNDFDHFSNFQNINRSFEGINKEKKIESIPTKRKLYSNSEFTEQTSMINTFNETNSQFISFQTAAGKPLNVSDKALEAAQRLFNEVCSQEIDMTEDKKECIIKSNVLGNINSDLKESKHEDDMNATLVQNLFEDIPFDEKEMECKVTDQSLQSSYKKPSITTSIMHSNKKRKSLGGRRNLKPYSSKK